MSTHNAIYIRATDPKTIAAIKKKYRKATTEQGSEFYCVPKHDDDFECPEKEMAKLSAQLKTDVIWLSSQSTSDSFQFHHWSDGEHLRSLIYQCFEGPGWEGADGDAESWEQEAFFSQDSLKSFLEFAGSAAEKKEITRVFRDREIAAGSEVPSVSANAAAWVVGVHFHLPGWSSPTASKAKEKRSKK